MTRSPAEIVKIDEQVEGEKLAVSSALSVVLFERADVLVAMYAPRQVDTQRPHDRDEFYIVSSGTGSFRCREAVVEFKAGDLLFVPALAEHCFQRFSEDFRAWVIFFGERRVAS